MSLDPSREGGMSTTMAPVEPRLLAAPVARYTLLEGAAGQALYAPSAYNSQPWLFHLTGDALELHADMSRRRPIADPRDREIFLASGAALENVRLAVRNEGFEPVISILPDRTRPAFVASIRVGTSRRSTASDRQLFAAIPHRRSSRALFYDRPIPKGLAPALRQIMEAEHGALLWLPDAQRRFDLVQLVAQADRLQGSNPQFRAELAAWMHANDTQMRDGMPGYAFGLPDTLATLAPLLLRAIPWDRMRVVADGELATHSPLLGVVATQGDQPRDWIIGGQAMQRALLFATSQGLSTGFMNQAIQVAETREALRALLHTGLWPQVALRFGFGPEPRATPRRLLNEVLRREA
jgi:nitroreductase